MSKQILLSVLFGIINIIHSYSYFDFHLDALDKFCLNDFFSDQTLVTYNINADSSHSFDVYLSDNNDRKLIEKHDTHNFKDSFTTFNGGYYYICIINKTNEKILINFECKHGIAAKDYTNVATLKEIQPIELDLIKLEDSSKSLYHLIMYSDSHEKIYGDLNDGLLGNISWISISVIFIMLIIGIIEAIVGNKIVKSKKFK